MKRLTNEQGELISCTDCSDNDCYICVNVICALEKLKHYEDLESQLEKVCGEELEESVEYGRVSLDNSNNSNGARVYLTHEETKIVISVLEEIQKYKKIGTIKECEEARDKQRSKIG